ncbi:hypothetical protein [Pedobacter panaciterrae]
MMLNWIFVSSFVLCLQVSASTFSQGTKVDLELHRVKLKEALNVLEKKGNIRFLYSEDDLSGSKDVTLVKSQIFVSDALMLLLKNTNLEFQELEDNLVVIRLRNASAADILVKGLVTDANGT